MCVCISVYDGMCVVGGSVYHCVVLVVMVVCLCMFGSMCVFDGVFVCRNMCGEACVCMMGYVCLFDGVCVCVCKCIFNGLKELGIIHVFLLNLQSINLKLSFDSAFWECI